MSFALAPELKQVQYLQLHVTCKGFGSSLIYIWTLIKIPLFAYSLASSSLLRWLMLKHWAQFELSCRNVLQQFCFRVFDNFSFAPNVPGDNHIQLCQSLVYDFHLETGFNPAAVLQGRSLRACGPVFTHPLWLQISFSAVHTNVSPFSVMCNSIRNIIFSLLPFYDTKLSK